MPASTARPTIERPTKGAKTSGKSVTKSILNIDAEMFRDDERFASALEALDRGDFGRAERALSDLLSIESESDRRAFLLNKRGVARVGLERRDLAESDFREALEARPRYAPALTNLGNVLLEQGRVEQAIASYERAITADDGYALAYWNLGAAYKRAGRISESVRALRRAQRLATSASAARSWRRAPRR